ncbi:hypothetical protein [Mesorhizobium silamurunense]|nr:hypothetical protein [Mesorhizobium silamurunense]
MPARKVAALAARCAILSKPAAQTPRSGPALLAQGAGLSGDRSR